MNRINRKRGLLCILCFILLAAPLFSSDVFAFEMTEKLARKVVRVGFPTQKNVTDKTEDGVYFGYTVDYLEELVKFTDWDIEYVEVEGDINEQMKKFGSMLDSGEIDMLGMMYYNEALLDYYLFPAYSYGSTYTSLTVAEDKTLWQTDDYSSWNGIRVATYPTLNRRMEQLKDYAQICGFTYETVMYDTMEEMREAVRSGDADACLQVDIDVGEGLRTIARFNPTPYYFAINKDRTDLLRELNAAMYSLLDSHPGFQSELYSRYFLHRSNFTLSDTDRTWIESLPALNVLYFRGNMPIQNESDGKPVGVAASFLKDFCEKTGLKVRPVFADDFEECRSLIEAGRVDIIAGVACLSDISSEFRIKLTQPYFESSTVAVFQTDGVKPDEEYNSVSANVEQELNAVKRGKGTPALLDAYCVSYYMRKESVYNRLYVEWANKHLLHYSFGVLPSVDDRLVGIINGYVSSISDQTKQQMLYYNSQEPLSYTIWEWLEIYCLRIVLSVLGVILLVVIMVRRRHNRAMKNKEDEMERLRQFSIMIHESLIQYDIKNDCLIMQNSKLVFRDCDRIEAFMTPATLEKCKTENEKRYVSQLQKMIKKRLAIAEIVLEDKGEPHWFRIDLAFVNHEYVIGRLSDIDEEKRARVKLESEANHDNLTGLLNRLAIQSFINDHLMTHKEGIFLLLDLDNFKCVNDNLGHQEGDLVLQRFARFLENRFRRRDIKARLGGDEFVVFLPYQMPEADLEKRLTGICRDVRAQVFSDYDCCDISVSIGAAYVSERSNTFDTLYKDADNAMYVAKYGGKNSSFVSDGTICTRKACVGCKDQCKKRDYLLAHGVENPEIKAENVYKKNKKGG